MDDNTLFTGYLGLYIILKPKDRNVIKINGFEGYGLFIRIEDYIIGIFRDNNEFILQVFGKDLEKILTKIRLDGIYEKYEIKKNGELLLNNNIIALYKRWQNYEFICFYLTNLSKILNKIAQTIGVNKSVLEEELNNLNNYIDIPF